MELDPSLVKSKALEGREEILGDEEMLMRRIMSKAHVKLEAEGIDLSDKKNVNTFISGVIEANKDIFPRIYKSLLRQPWYIKMSADKEGYDNQG